MADQLATWFRPMPKPDPEWRIIVIGGRKAEHLGIIEAPNAEAAIDKACEHYGIDATQRHRLIAQPVGPRATK
jgi:hypothetical protein